jgi:RNA polymerase sigma factor (sigma-70 family)
MTMTNPTPDPTYLVPLALGGDLSALQTLLVSIQKPIFRLTLRMLGNRADAEDGTQEILLKVTTALSTFRGDSQFLTWAYRIAVNHVLADLRKNKVAINSLEQLSIGLKNGLAFGAGRSEPSPEENIEAFEVFVKCTQRMLSALDVDDRIAYVLGDLCDFSANEAALAIGVSSAAFRQRLSRARVKLSGFMNNECGVVDTKNSCRCAKQVPAAKAVGYLDGKTVYSLRLESEQSEVQSLQTISDAVQELGEIIRATRVFKSQDASLPAIDVSLKIRAMLESGSYRLLQ